MKLKIAIMIVTGMIFSIFAGDVQPAGEYETAFDDLQIQSAYGQNFWRTDDWRTKAQCYPIVEYRGGKALAVTAKNGHNARIYLEPRGSGGGEVSFDFTPDNGMWTFFGFKTDHAKWDEYQAAVLFSGAADGKLYRLSAGKKIQFPDAGFVVGKNYRVTIIYCYREGKGYYQVTVRDLSSGKQWESGELSFETAGDKPITAFEIRSVEWSKPAAPINGYVDNVSLKFDRSYPIAAVRSGRFGHLYYPGEAVRINASVSANQLPVKAPVQLSVCNAYGEEVFTQLFDVDLRAGEENRFSAEIPAEKLIKYGLYTQRLTIAGERGVTVSSSFGIVAPARPDEDTFASPFGAFHYPVEGIYYPEFNDKRMAGLVTQMRMIGIRWVRANFHWYNVEPEKGNIEWGLMGAMVDELYRQNMHAFIELSNTARWASSSQSDFAGSIDTGTQWQAVAPKNFEDWENFCRLTVRRYHDRVKVWEIWNEPGAPRNGKSNGFWRDSSDNFVKIIKHAARVVREEDPHAKVMISGFRPVDIGQHFENFFERVVPYVINDVDIISFHNWGKEAWSPKILDLKILLKQYGRELPYWDSEGPGAGNTPANIKNFIWTWSSGAQKVFPFIYNLPRYANEGMVNPDFTPHAGTMTFAAMTRFLSGLQPEGQVNPGEGIRGFSFTDGKRRIVVAWSEIPGKPAVATLSGLIAAYDCYGNPSGEVKQGLYRRNSVEVTNYPCFLELDFDRIDQGKQP